MSWEYLNVKVGTEVMAPPGAQTCTPTPPSIVGPLEDHVYGAPETIVITRFNTEAQTYWVKRENQFSGESN